MDGKIALEEHFNLAEFTEALPQYVSPQAMKQIEPGSLMWPQCGWRRWTPRASSCRCFR